MKIILLIFVLIFVESNSLYAQFLNNNFLKIIKDNKRTAKRNLICKEGSDINDKFLNISYANKLEYLPVSSFVLSKNGVVYDSTISITNFIVFNKKSPLQDFYTLKNGNYEGVKSLFNDVYFDGKGFSSSYDSSKVFLQNNYNSIMHNTFQVLQKHNFKFLFAVKYFRNAIWFIEDQKVYLLDTRELKIYEPDEYIKQKCSIHTIHKLSRGELDKYCD